MKQSIAVIAILTTIFFTASCGSNSQQTTLSTDSTTAQSTSSSSTNQISSYELFKKTLTDNFYIKQQSGKEVSVTNLIPESYLFDRDRNVTVTCLVYSPETMTLVGGSNIGGEMRDNLHVRHLINGNPLTIANKIGSRTIDPGIGPYEVIIKLKNPRDVQNLSFYDGSKLLNIIQAKDGIKNYVDVITINGVLTEYSAAPTAYGGMYPMAYRFDNVTFTKQTPPAATKIPEKNPLIGTWASDDKNVPLQIDIEVVNADGTITGIDTYGENRSDFSGTKSGSNITLTEQSDHMSKGTFNITYSGNKLIGTFKSDDERISYSFKLSKV